MRDRHKFDIEYYTDNLAFAILLSSLLSRDLYSKWLIEVEVLPEGYLIVVKNNVSGLFRRKKDILKERNDILNLIRVAENSGIHSSVYSGDLYIDKENINMSCIDPSIRPLVATINSIPSVWTTFSCCGHVFRVPRNPYVSFFAVDTRQVIQLSQIINSGKTHYRWLLRGTVFDNKVQWQITTEIERTLFNSKKINEDIDRLSAEITRMSSAQKVS